MSVDASGGPGHVRQLLRVALVLGVLTVVGGPLVPAATAAGGLTVTTAFPAVVAEAGDTASFDLALDVDSARRVDLRAEGVPDGWTARFRGGGLTIDGAYVEPGDAPDVTLDVEIPDGAPAGSSTITVVASGGGGSDRLALSIRIAEAAAGQVTLSSDFPELSGAADATFSYTLTLENDTPASITFAIGATGPAGWTVDATPAGQAQATSLAVDANGSATINVSAEPPADVDAGTYPLQVTATGDGKTASIDLAATVTGTYSLTLSTPDQVLSTTANAGSPKDLGLTLTSSGSAPVTAVTLSATTPTGWTVEFDPASIASAAPGTPATINATITPSADAIAGDYELTLSADGAEASDSVSIRVRVETPQLWWIVGVGLIAIVFGGLYWVFRTYGRR